MSTTVLAPKNRDNPGADFIRRMSETYPVEAEFETLLRSKLERRAEPRRGLYTLQELKDALEAMLRDTLNDAFSVKNVRWLVGGASKMQMAFELTWTDPEIGPTTSSMVLRMEPAESLNTTSRRREFELLNAFRDVVPVPRTYWLDAEARWFPQPAFIYAFATGVTKPSRMDFTVSGIGQRFPPDLRASLGKQFVEYLARIHTHVPDPSQLTAFYLPEAGSTQSAVFQLNRARRVWEEDRGHDLPIFDVAFNWLTRNLPELDRPSLLHGDYRAGNFMFDEASGQLTTWLDWERGYVGDRHRDLAWTTTSSFGSYDEDGTFLVSGLVPLDEFFSEYERLSGLSVDKEKLKFYRVLNCFQVVVSAIGTAYRLVHLGKTHQDILLAWVEGVGYTQAEALRTIMEEEIG